MTDITPGRRRTLVENLRDATVEYEAVTDEALVGAVQNWLESQRAGTQMQYGFSGGRLLDDLKRFAEAGL